MRRLSIKEYYQSDKKVIIWGSGSGYIRWSQQFDFQASYIVDNNAEKCGTFIGGVEIKSPQALLQEKKDEIIIFVLSFFFNEINEQLISMGLEDSKIISLQMLEQRVFTKSRIRRRKEFLSNNPPSIQSFMETIVSGMGDSSYRDVKLFSVMLPYISLMASYLYEEDMYKFLFPVPQIRKYAIRGNAPILVSYVWQKDRRRDHFELVESVFSEFPEGSYMSLELKSYYDESVDPQQQEFSFNVCDLRFKPFVEKASAVLYKKELYLSESEINWFKQFITYFLHFVDFAYSLLELYPIKKYVSAFPNNSEENIFIQAAKHLGIQTFGLQHGYYGKKEEFNTIPFSHVYRYPTVDTMLVWGELHERVLKDIQVDSSNIIVVGNAKYNNTVKYRSEILAQRTEFINHNKFLIMLMGPGNGEKVINQELLSYGDQLASQCSLKYDIKLHPGANLSMTEFVYDITNCADVMRNHVNIKSLLHNYDFVLISSSTSILEAIYEFIPVFVYDCHPAVQSICGGLSTIFNNYDQLKCKVSDIMQPKKFIELMHEYDWFGNQIFNTDDSLPSRKYKEIILESTN